MRIFNNPENISFDDVTEEFGESIRAHLSDGSPHRVLKSLKSEYTVNEMEDLLLYFIDFHKNAEELLHQFWQRNSDACPLESSEADKEIIEWRKWIYKPLY